MIEYFKVKTKENFNAELTYENIMSFIQKATIAMNKKYIEQDELISVFGFENRKKVQSMLTMLLKEGKLKNDIAQNWDGSYLKVWYLPEV